MTDDAAAEDGGEMNTNIRPTVAKVMEFLGGFPSDYRVSIYEGEGGNWIFVGKADEDDERPCITFLSGSIS